jgi:hypothetical protein
VVGIANKVSHYLYRNAERGQSAIRFLDIERLCQAGLGLTEGELQILVEDIGEEVRDSAEAMDIVVDDWRIEPAAFPASSDAEDSPIPAADARRDRQRLQLLLDAHALAGAGEDFTEFMAVTSRTLVEALDLTFVFLLIHNKDYGCLEAKFGFGPDVESIREKIAVRTDTPDDAAARAFLRNEPVIVTPENLHEFSRLSEANLVGLLGTFNLAAYPLRRKGRVRSVLVAARHGEGETFDSEERQILSMYVEYVEQIFQSMRGKEQTRVLPAVQTEDKTDELSRPDATPNAPTPATNGEARRKKRATTRIFRKDDPESPL